MRTLARLGIVGTVAAAALVVAAPLAVAGGPTSVLLVSPRTHGTASMYNSDDGYGRLEKLLGENPTADRAAPAVHGGPGTDAINVTWLAHDVNVWRVDRIFLEADGGPWVETMISTDGPLTFDKSGVVHKPTDGAALISFLSGLKLLGDTAPSVGLAGGSPVVAEQPVVSQPVATVATEREIGGPNWLWLVVGAAAGATIVVGVRPLLVRRRQPQLASVDGPTRE
jgi:hypothetical protein